jgi:lycopene cyclase domain-containing protein
MHNFVYLLFNILVFVPVLILSIFTDVKPHIKWRALLGAYMFVNVPFILWDVWAAQAGHWGFNESYVYSTRFWGLPFEEILFFFTVPFAMMYVWGVVNKHVTDRVFGKKWPLLAMGVLAVLSLVLLAKFWGNGYTRSAMIATIIAIVAVAYSKLLFSYRFWVFQLVLLGIFVVANSILTALPIITYGDASIIDTRILTIPIEDFFFNFAFLNIFLVFFVRLSPQKTKT